MSISNTTYIVSGSGDGVTTTFSFPYRILLTTDLVVTLTQTSTGSTTTKVLGTDYSVTINPSYEEGGSVTFTVAPPVGYTYTITRTEPFTQSLSIPTEGAIPPQQLTNALDLLTMLCIQMQGQINNNIGPQGPVGPQGPAGGGVSSVTSANSDISVASSTTAPVLTLNSGTGDNQILKLNASAQIPAVDASLVLNVLKKVKVVQFTRDISTATGTQVITGVGFQPKLVLFFGSTGNSLLTNFFGADDGATPSSLMGVSSGNQQNDSNGSLTFTTDNSTTIATGFISAFSSNGFTISWVKTGSPTGTAFITAVCIG